jgi:lipid II:glycine glycyltransferase (peptidoglycan interpeptide bridge formation enzyme)
MLVIDESARGIFRSRIVWFADEPVDMEGFACLTFRQCAKKVEKPGFIRSEFTTLTLDLTKDLEVLWEGFNAKSCRYKINRAIREGVIIERSNDLELFRAMNINFAQKKGIDNGDFDVEKIGPVSQLFLASYKEQVLGGQLYLADKNKMRLLFGASKRFGQDKELERSIGFSNRLLVWEAIKWGKEAGLKEYDFGGYYTGSKPDTEKENINNFKKSFSGELVTHYNYYKEYSRLFSLSGRLLNIQRSFLGSAQG